MTDQVSFGELLLRAQEQFAEKGLNTPALDARLLLQEAANFDHAGIISRSQDVVSTDVRSKLHHFVRRRLSGEPVQRILGKWEFYGRQFRLSEDTLVPRPDTESLVEYVLRTYGETDRQISILDIGTGSGAVGVTLACELCCAKITVTDVSQNALDTAKENAHALGVIDRIKFVNSDMFDKIEGRFDVIVSNPPYISSSDIENLQPEVRFFEPILALDGGSDGLQFYREIADKFPEYLNPNGLLVVEVGIGQADAVANLIEYSCGKYAAIEADLSGIDRIVAIRIGRES